jgi:hypothetical protein
MRLRFSFAGAALLMAMIAADTQADSPLNQTKWTIEQLANSTCTINWHRYRFTNSEYYVNTAEVKESYDIVESLTVAGDLNADGVDDYFVLIESTFGGSGVFLLAIARPSSSGNWVDTMPFDISDRVGVEKVSIRESVVNLDMIVHGPNDAACCPSVKTVWKLRLDEKKLVKFEGIDDR